MSMRARLVPVFLLLVLLTPAAFALDRPWISDVFFYWYTWDYDQEMGGWLGGVYNTPLQGYYDSRRYEDNLASLHTASEWGITHHFMDYWGPGWQDLAGKPREDLLMQATGQLQDEQLTAFMSVYQDGTDFDMAQFSRNLDTGRGTEFTSAASPSPGLPDGERQAAVSHLRAQWLPEDHGHRRRLRRLAGGEVRDSRRTQRALGTDFAAFSTSSSALGPRVTSERSPSSTSTRCGPRDGTANEAAKTPSAFRAASSPGMWATGRFRLRVLDQARVFCGPHSYGGIFGVPHAQDVGASSRRRWRSAAGPCLRHVQELLPRLGDPHPRHLLPPDFSAFDRFWYRRSPTTPSVCYTCHGTSGGRVQPRAML